MEFEVVEKNGKKYYFQKGWGKVAGSWDEASKLTEKVVINGKEYLATLQSREFWEEVGKENFNKNKPHKNKHFWTTTSHPLFSTIYWIWYGYNSSWNYDGCYNANDRARLGFVVEE